MLLRSDVFPIPARLSDRCRQLAVRFSNVSNFSSIVLQVYRRLGCTKATNDSTRNKFKEFHPFVVSASSTPSTSCQRIELQA
mmetsp:Transcript_11359/g.21634  ORF Transcript_11359/g.21634 Transcript_11359/m.21634 type:complete len:82 (+) Transcript_11359:79-324(+)